MVDTFTERHGLPVAAAAAILTRVGWVHSSILPASFFRFAGQLPEELRPRGIMNALRKAMVMRHALDMQVFDSNDAELIHNPTALLMGEVVTSKLDTLMDTRNHLAMCASLWRALSKLSVLALDLCQRFLLLAKEARIRNLSTSGEGSKRLESYVNPDVCRCFWKAFRLALAGKRDIPFARAASLNGAHLELALERPMIGHLDAANLGETHPIIMGDAKPRLREGERIIAMCATKTRETRLLGMVTCSAKEGLKGQVDAYGHILQHLRMNSSASARLTLWALEAAPGRPQITACRRWPSSWHASSMLLVQIGSA
jgi:hypothetical protein